MAARMGVFRGDRLKTIRRLRGISQERLAEALTSNPDKPFPQQQVSKWESGAADPSAEMLVRVSDLLSVSVDYLLGIVDDPGERLRVELPRDVLRERLNWALDNNDLSEALEVMAAITKRDNESGVAGG